MHSVICSWIKYFTTLYFAIRYERFKYDKTRLSSVSYQLVYLINYILTLDCIISYGLHTILLDEFVKLLTLYGNTTY